ncbi:MAG: hypothetical protein ABIL18_00560, partial [candidate division WOR-3 bacterium]
TPGNYWIVVKAWDAAGNEAKDSMMVTVPGPTVEEGKTAVFSNKIPSHLRDIGQFLKRINGRLYDINGRAVNNVCSLNSGVYFILYNNNGLCYKKVIIVR